MTLYRRRELPPEPWTHEDNPEWILVEVFDAPSYMLVPVELNYEAAAMARIEWGATEAPARRQARAVVDAALGIGGDDEMA